MNGKVQSLKNGNEKGLGQKCFLLELALILNLHLMGDNKYIWPNLKPF